MAPFSTTEKISAADKLVSQLLGTSNIAPGEKYWYNEVFSYAPILPPDKFWNEFNTIPGALTQAAAIANVGANPSILERKAMRLTLDTTTNNRTYIARDTFGDNTSGAIGNWILPALIQINGGPSAGYGTSLYHGDPTGAGVEITAVYNSGPLGQPCWDWKYGVGVLNVSDDEASHFRTTFYDINGLYVWGFRYIGTTGGGGFVENNIVTASIEINNIVQDGRYSGNEIQLVVIDDAGHVVVI